MSNITFKKLLEDTDQTIVEAADKKAKAILEAMTFQELSNGESKSPRLLADEYEIDLEENFDKGESYSPETEEKKIQQLVSSAKEYRQKKG